MRRKPTFECSNPRHCHSNKDYLQRWLVLLDTSTFTCSLLFKGSYLVSCCQCSVMRKTLNSSGLEQSKGSRQSHFFISPTEIKLYLDAHTPPISITILGSLEGSWSLPWVSASSVLTALGKERKMHRLIKNLKGNLAWIRSVSEALVSNWLLWVWSSRGYSFCM